MAIGAKVTVSGQPRVVMASRITLSSGETVPEPCAVTCGGKVAMVRARRRNDVAIVRAVPLIMLPP